MGQNHRAIGGMSLGHPEKYAAVVRSQIIVPFFKRDERQTNPNRGCSFNHAVSPLHSILALQLVVDSANSQLKWGEPWYMDEHQFKNHHIQNSTLHDNHHKHKLKYIK